MCYAYSIEGWGHTADPVFDGGIAVPSLPKRPCAVPGCPNFACKGGARCAEHDRLQPRRIARESDALYKTGAWRALRTQQLRRAPLCAECLRAGKIVPATEVDHITPHKGDVNLFFDAKNLQSLCKKCHARKTAREDGGFGNPKRNPGA